MTLGEKLREARKKRGLSQEQLADKLSVSRSAVAKWETDKGLPDVGNLKYLARLLNVSVDYLLDEGTGTEDLALREPIRLADYGPGCKKLCRDRAVLEKLPDARIYALLAQREQPEREPEPDACRRAARRLMPEPERSFYLALRENGALLVTVTDLYVELRPLEQLPEGGSFVLNGWRFIRSNYELSL